MLVRDLIAILNTVDPDMDVRITMNMEYDGDVGSIYTSHGSLYLDDCSVDDFGTTLYVAN